MNDGFERLQVLFLQAREIPEENRQAWLNDNCPDAELRHEVIELLRHDLPDTFLEHPIVGCPSPQVPDSPSLNTDQSTEALPDSGSTAEWLAGRYKLLQKIGEGGFGIVYMAEQVTPVRRKVAVKRLRANMDSRGFVARFESERQALAMMDHNHIAKIFDGGVDRDGRPFLVMELVNGIPITQFCHKFSLSIRERIILLVRVCQAVHHAHQKGIIHRDLKPSNILISQLDGTPLPKVIDFGIAKALNGPLTDKTLFTAFHQMIGTLEYMSPEQAETSIFDADTRSDVFSLGVIAYELLTGTTPFDGDTLRKLPFAEIQRTIREVEPPKPSTRLSALTHRSTIEAPRNIGSSLSTKSIHGDLDWIVMKAMDKSRERRYGSAQALEEDLRRWLDDEPVEARPPSVVYRLTKMVRKYRRSISIAAAIVSGAILSAAGIGYGLAERSAAQQRMQDQLEKNQQIQQIADMEKDRASSLAYGNAMLAANESIVNGRRQTTLELLKECPETKRGIEWHWQSYLAADHSQMLIPSGNEQKARSIEFTHDGQRLISGSRDGMVRVWDAVQGQEIRSWRLEQKSAITALAIDRSNRHLLCGTADGHIALLKFETGQQMGSWELNRAISSVAITDSDTPRWAIGCEDGAVFQSNEELTQQPYQLQFDSQPLRGPVQSISCSEDGNKWIVAGQGGVILFDCELRAVVRTWGEPWVSYGAIQAGGLDRLAIYGPPVGLVDLINGGKRLKSIEIPSTEIVAAKYIASEDSLIVATEDQSLRRILLADGSQETIAYTHAGAISKLAAANDGNSLAVVCDDGSLRFWKRFQLIAPERLKAFDAGVVQIAASDCQHVYALSDTGELVCWDAAAREVTTRVTRHRDQGFGLAIDSRNHFIATNGIDQKLVISSLPMLNPVATHDLSLVARHIDFHPDGQHLIGPAPSPWSGDPLGAADATDKQAARMVLRDFRTGEIKHSYRGLTNWAMKVKFSKDGSMLAAATVSDGALVWVKANETPFQYAIENFPQAEDVAFSSDNRFLFVGYRNGQVCVWNLPTKEKWETSSSAPIQQQPHSKMVCHGDLVSALLVTSDGSRLVTSSIGDSKLRVWDWRNAQKVAEFETGLPGITDMDFVEDQKAIVLASTNGQIMLMRLK